MEKSPLGQGKELMKSPFPGDHLSREGERSGVGVKGESQSRSLYIIVSNSGQERIWASSE